MIQLMSFPYRNPNTLTLDKSQNCIQADFSVANINRKVDATILSKSFSKQKMQQAYRVNEKFMKVKTLDPVKIQDKSLSLFVKYNAEASSEGRKKALCKNVSSKTINRSKGKTVNQKPTHQGTKNSYFNAIVSK